MFEEMTEGVGLRVVWLKMGEIVAHVMPKVLYRLRGLPLIFRDLATPGLQSAN